MLLNLIFDPFSNVRNHSAAFYFLFCLYIFAGWAPWGYDCPKVVPIKNFKNIMKKSTSKNPCIGVGLRISKKLCKTLQELQMLSSVTLNCEVTKVVKSSGSQLSEL